MAKAGRKGWKEELRLYERYSDLTEDYFSFLKEMFESEDKKDRMWASDQLSKGLVKMIPQTLEHEGGDGVQPILVKFIGNEGDTDTNGVQKTS